MSKPVFTDIGSSWLCVSSETGRLYVFTPQGFAKLVENYRLGNCIVTEKGLARYSDEQWMPGSALAWTRQHEAAREKAKRRAMMPRWSKRC